MFVTITDDTSDDILYQRAIDDNEPLDCDHYAIWFAGEYFDTEVSFAGHVPLGCGLFSVELAEQPKTAVCWQARSYFLD